MKVGIMTMQRIVNYGSWLQAYGLKSVLESMGHHVEFVDYLPEPSLIPEAVPCKSAAYLQKVKNACKLLSPAYRKYRAEQIRMNQSFGSFYQQFQEVYFPALGLSASANLCPELDALVIGSDEVFNCTQPGTAVGYSLQLFGKDHNAKTLISYAASFGSTTLERLDHFSVREEVAAYLSHFDALSVRDENSATIVTSLCRRVPSQNIDPVLLYPFPEAEEIAVSEKDYIVVYAYAGRIREEEAQAIQRFAAKHNKTILSLGFFQPFCDTYVQATPLEVLAYIKHADYVITDTFHGTIFSIKYQKKFATLIRDSNCQKLTDLLNRFALEGRRVTRLDTLESVLTKDIPAEKIVQLLEEYRLQAREYLSGALGNEL